MSRRFEPGDLVSPTGSGAFVAKTKLDLHRAIWPMGSNDSIEGMWTSKLVWMVVECEHVTAFRITDGETTGWSDPRYWDVMQPWQATLKRLK